MGHNRRQHVTDRQARLHQVPVVGIATPQTVAELHEVVREQVRMGEAFSICGQRHSMGGQPFLTDRVLVDASAINSMVSLDVERGLVTVGAGMTWPELLVQLDRAQQGSATPWTIRQKQTGANNMSIGGAVSVNAHGRGLAMKPMVDDVEALTLIDSSGTAVLCDRSRTPELFRHIIGGYGLFGAIATVTLRLNPRCSLERRVWRSSAASAVAEMERARDQGALYGDFQCVTDENDARFMDEGIVSVYFPTDEAPREHGQRVLSNAVWLKLVHLAHTDKASAWREYSGHYFATSGQRYWSGEMQLAPYVESYPDDVLNVPSGPGGSDVITDLFVPRAQLGALMGVSAEVIRRNRASMIYSTVRLIQQDQESALPWATQPWACIVLNLHMLPGPKARADTERTFRELIDGAISVGGSFFLPYHRFATASQLLHCHPSLREFLAEKRRIDPRCIFSSDWWHHVSDQVDSVRPDGADSFR